MKELHFIIISFILLFHIYHINGAFSPDRTNYDAFGVKIAMNDYILVQANNGKTPPSFFVQFAPYNSTSSSSQCSISYPDISQDYVYCVAVGKSPDLNQRQFFFAGQSVDNDNGTFIGVAKYNSTSSTNSCSSSYSYSIQYLTSYTHQEYYVIGVEPKGLLAYGFANDFVFVFDSQNVSSFESWNNTLIWPNATFSPHAVDINNNFGIVAGFVKNNPNARVKYSPIIYLVNFNASNHRPVVVHQHVPDVTSGTWQDLLTNDNANVYTAKYSMSISINSRGYILVGMPFINRVLLLSVNINNPTQLHFMNRSTNGRTLGNGKSVAWLNDGDTAAILVNTYSLAYQWISSVLSFFDMRNNNYTSNSTPISVFPNYHQALPSGFSSTFLNAISSTASLTLMDDTGSLLIFNPTPPGYFPSIPDTASIPTVTTPMSCLPGMYKDKYGVHDCILCPMGTKYAGNSTVTCTPCASKSLCSLGSVTEIPISEVKSASQVYAYPESPESTIFEEILIQNMFKIGSGRCIVISPLFWSLIAAGFGILLITLVGILHFCAEHPNSTRIKDRIQKTLQKIDLIREGELWVGGIASLSLIIMLSFAYAFSNAYFKQYPIESSSDLSLACDQTIRNAKFETGLQSLGIPRTHSEEEMFDMLEHQQFTLNVDFLNTFISCDAVSLQALYGTTWYTLRWTSCTNVSGILSLSILLPFQQTSIEITLSDMGTIGALRVGLSGHNEDKELHHVKELNTYRTFSSIGFILGRTLPLTLSVTKVINETLPIDGEEGNYTGVYTITYGADLYTLFLNQDLYNRLTSTETVLTILISQTSYYVKNVQHPIVKRAELIFHNLLFTVVCFEIFGLIFVLYKLIIEPLYHIFVRKCCTKHEKYQEDDKKKPDGNLIYKNDGFNTDTNVEPPMKFNF